MCIGALIIKELFGISDDEVVENLMLDPRYQYALHTSSFEEQPLSDKTLTRFRKRCYDYESIHGIDLLHECMTGLGTNIAKLMDISPRVKRMDSMMIAANIRKLSRIELLYTCVKKLVIYFHKNSRDELIKGMEHYCDPNDYNKTFYYSNDSDTENHLAAILKDADRLLDLCGTDYDDITEYQLLVRCLSEQTIVEEGFRRLRTKEDGGFHSGILQNPSDPDATYRSKAGKEHQGYVANLEETVDRNGSVITDYQFEQNIYSDSRFLKDSLERTEVQEKKSTLITDGAYSGKENHDLAAQKNIRLINTDLSGKPVDDILADFVFNETGTKVKSVEKIAELYTANGALPVYKTYYKNQDIAFYLSRVGAPACVAGFEEVVAMGAKKFVMFGSCGVLDDEKVKDNMIIPVSAVRDEGTSYHYIAPSEEIKASEHSIRVLQNVLEFCGYSYVKGKTWTSDAIYRETIPAIEERRQEGCLAVEMECASMLAVSQYRQIPFIQFLYGADSLSSEKWEIRDLELYGLTNAEKYMLLAFECGLAL